MENLGLENANVCYHQDFLSKETADDLFRTISKMFDIEENKMVYDDNNKPLYQLNRKTIVYTDRTINKNVVPKIWYIKINQYLLF